VYAEVLTVHVSAMQHTVLLQRLLPGGLSTPFSPDPACFNVLSAAYKTHGTVCTEVFYKEHIKESLASDKHELAAADNSHLIDAIKRAQGSEDTVKVDGKEEEGELDGQRLYDLANCDDLSMDSLTLAEQQRFERAVASGSLSACVEPWTSWWDRFARLSPQEADSASRQGGPALITEIGGNQQGQGAVEHTEGETVFQQTPISSAACPPAVDLSALPRTGSVTKAPLAPGLKYNALDIIFAYVHVMRVYNGEWASDPIRASALFLTISGVLGRDCRYEDALSAFTALSSAVLHQYGGSVSSDLTELHAQIRMGFQDTMVVASTQHLAARAFSDCEELLRAARRDQRDTAARKDIKRIQKKVS
jgi:hypothetical protein